MVADAGRDVAEVVQVGAGQGVEQQAADDLDVAELAAVHDRAAAGRLAGKTVLIPAGAAR